MCGLCRSVYRGLEKVLRVFRKALRGFCFTYVYASVTRSLHQTQKPETLNLSSKPEPKPKPKA